MNSPLLVVCLCAQWCGSCRDYRAVFDQARVEFGDSCRFVWVDIEDDADFMGNVDVDNFPTVLLAGSDKPLFFGAITPHAQTLHRLVGSALTGDLQSTDFSTDVLALAARLAGLPQ